MVFFHRIFLGKIDIFIVTQGITINQCDKYKRAINIFIKLRFCKTGPSLLQEEPYQTAIPDNVNAVIEIGQ